MENEEQLEELDFKTMEKTKVYIDNVSPEEKVMTLTTIKDFYTDIAEEIKISKEESYEQIDIDSMIKILISNLQQKLNKQLDLVMHHPKFTELSGKWLGLEYLLKNNYIDNQNIKMKVLNISKKELIKDLTRNEWDRSNLFTLCYESEIGTYGGEPFSFIVHDHYYSANMQDIELMNKISAICAAAHSPCISGVNPNMLNLESFSELNTIKDYKRMFETKLAWKSFRESEDARYFSLVLPKTMGRSPYSTSNNPHEFIEYDEVVDPNNEHHFVWINSAYALANRIIEAQGEFGWTAAIRGIESGGLVDNLPYYTYINEEGENVIKSSIEVCATERKEKELSDLGFIVLCSKKNSNESVFFGTQTCQKPKIYDDEAATLNAQLSAGLQYMLLVSRFAQYVKAIMKTSIGSFKSKENIQTALSNWISKYVLLNDSASQEMKIKMPLKGANIKVVEKPGEIGVYNAIIWIEPRLQLEGINVSIRLVAKLPKSK